MKLAIEIIKNEISLRELANKHIHLRRNEVNAELASLRKVLSITLLEAKINETIEMKKRQLEEVLICMIKYNNGDTKYLLKDLDKNEIEIKAQLSILYHLLDNE